MPVDTQQLKPKEKTMKPEHFADFANALLSTGLMNHQPSPAAVLAAKVDRLGQLAADAAAIKLEADRLRAELEDAGLSEIHGHQYRASFAQCKGAQRIDWKTIAAKFKPSAQLIRAHTTTGDESTRMTIKAHPTH
jgi:histidinol-phosphate/aromatic aminotransferase/cobyric acid decarboxylase-like protein